MYAQEEINYSKATLMTVLKLLLNHINLTPNALARELDLPAPTINRLVTGEVTDPRASTLTAIADYFGIRIDQLLGKEALNGKFGEHESGQSLVTRPPLSIPILTLTEAADYEKYCKTSTDWLRWQKQPHDNSYDGLKDIFAVSIKNSLYEPIFKNGSYIIVNPNISNPNNGDYVLVKFSVDSNVAIKKYIREGHNKYLYSLNPDIKTIMLDENDCCIIGVIIEAYISFKNN